MGELKKPQVWTEDEKGFTGVDEKSERAASVDERKERVGKQKRNFTCG